MFEDWTPEMHRLREVLPQMSVDDVAECPGMTPEQARMVAKADYAAFVASGKQFVSVKLHTRQVIKRVK